MPKHNPNQKFLPAIRVPNELFNRLEVEAFDLGEKVSAVVRSRLAHSFKADGAPLAPTKTEAESRRKIVLENQLKELELGRRKALFILKDDAVGVLIDDSYAKKQFFEQLPGLLPDDDIEKQRAWLKDEIEKTFADMVAIWSAKLQVKADELAAQRSV
jgi:hypothetical protein